MMKIYVLTDRQTDRQIMFENTCIDRFTMFENACIDRQTDRQTDRQNYLFVNLNLTL